MARTIGSEILALLEARGPEKTACPSEIARKIGGAEWRAKMPAVRAAAAKLVVGGQIEVTQRGRVVELATVRGPIRLRLSARRRAGA